MTSFMVWAQGIITMFGYPGIFLVAALSTISVFLPTFPLSLLVFLSGAMLNPLLVGLSAGFGSATGKKVLLKKYEKKINQVEELFQKYRGGLVIFVIAAIPVVPFDVIGLFCGVIGYDMKKFYIFLLAGKCVRYTCIAFAGFYGITWILEALNITP
jgi:membrane protein YqaA with SNARE-associated domain